MPKGQQYRHTPAFILLLLAQSEAYGATLLNRLETELPGYRTDSAAIYRTLQELEEAGAVTSSWEVDTGGAPKKWYRITPAGLQQLAAHREDIAMRQKLLEWFLEAYSKLEQ